MDAANPYSATAARLMKKLIVHSVLTSASVQSLAMASRAGLSMKYAVISTKTNAADSNVADSSLGLIFDAAFMNRCSGLPAF